MIFQICGKIMAFVRVVLRQRTSRSGSPPPVIERAERVCGRARVINPLESIRHKGLKRFATKGDRRIMKAERLADMLAFISAAPNIEALHTPPNFGFNPMTGNARVPTE